MFRGRAGLALTWSAGKNKEGEEASGTITIPEVAHDTEEDEYVVRSLRPQLLSYVAQPSRLANRP
jgi:hypothetical protein